MLDAERGQNVAKYRLRAATRKPDGTFDTPSFDDFIDANTLDEAIEKCRNHPAILARNTNHAWLTDENGTTVWELNV
jgi:hypothetical protein